MRPYVNLFLFIEVLFKTFPQNAQNYLRTFPRTHFKLHVSIQTAETVSIFLTYVL